MWLVGLPALSSGLYKLFHPPIISQLNLSSSQPHINKITLSNFQLFKPNQTYHHNGFHQAGCQLRFREGPAGYLWYREGGQQAGRQGL
jgi:hypothetical protein